MHFIYLTLFRYAKKKNYFFITIVTVHNSVNRPKVQRALSKSWFSTCFQCLPTCQQLYFLNRFHKKMAAIGVAVDELGQEFLRNFQKSKTPVTNLAYGPKKQSCEMKKSCIYFIQLRFYVNQLFIAKQKHYKN